MISVNSCLSRSIRGAAAVLCIGAFAALCVAEEASLTVTDEVAGGAVRYIGGYRLQGALASPAARKHLEGTEINCTKFWLLAPRQWRSSGEFLGPDFKEVAIRQVTRFPETIRWNEELSPGTQATDLAGLERDIKLVRQFGAQPVMNFKTKLYGRELLRRMYWRHVFLMNYYVNKVKDYKVVLWEFGCEDARQGPEQVEVGSDATRESAKLTGVPVLVAGPGEDGDADLDHKVVLASDYADRVDALSFHSFQWAEDFPTLGGQAPGGGGRWQPRSVKQVLAYIDGLQKQLRPDAPLLPYWDTGWNWKRIGGAGPTNFPPCLDPLTPMAYIGRLIQQCESRTLVNIYNMIYRSELWTEEGATTIGSAGGGAIQEQGGKLRVTPLFYAMRMMARANAGDKERLVLQGKPDDAVMQALATRSASQVFITCLSRKKDETIRITLKGLEPYKGKNFAVRRLDGKEKNDEVDTKGVVDGDLVVALPPLTALQVAIDRQ